MTPSVSQSRPLFKKMHVAWFVVLTFITGLIYYPVWFLRRRKAFNALQSVKKLGSGWLIYAIIAFSLNILLSDEPEARDGAGTLATIALIGLMFQAFRVRRILEDHLSAVSGQNIELSGVATFFFGAYYLQHTLNKFQGMFGAAADVPPPLPQQAAAFSPAAPMPTPKEREKEILRLAQRKGGRLTVLEVAAETSVTLEEAEQLLNDMSVRGHVGMQVADDGAMIYEFYGLGGKPTLEAKAAPLPSEPERKTPKQAPASPGVMQKTEANGLVFELLACTQRSGQLGLACAITSPASDCELIVGAARLFDTAGNEYRMKEVQVANKPPKDKVQHLFVEGVRVSAAFSFADLPPLETIPLFEFLCRDVASGKNFKVAFRQIAVAIAS